MELRVHIQRLLKERGLSVRGLAAKSGVRRQSISAFLTGANIHLDNLQKVLAALGMELMAGPLAHAAMALLEDRFPINRRKLSAICRKHGIRRLSLFGSILRPDFSSKSDIDILVEFHKPVSLFELTSIEEELAQLMPKGHRIDLVTEQALSRHFREEVMSQREVIYEEAA